MNLSGLQAGHISHDNWVGACTSTYSPYEKQVTLKQTDTKRCQVKILQEVLNNGNVI